MVSPVPARLLHPAGQSPLGPLPPWQRASHPWSCLPTQPPRSPPGIFLIQSFVQKKKIFSCPLFYIYEFFDIITSISQLSLERILFKTPRARIFRLVSHLKILNPRRYPILIIHGKAQIFAKTSRKPYNLLKLFSRGLRCAKT